MFTAPAKKQLGQHFLADRHYIDKIVMAVNPKDGDRLVEIGPGQGAITLPLLRVHPKLTVIEFDRDLIAPLTAAAEPLGELTIVHRDVLRVDFTELADGQPIRLVGNLPYNISSPILFHALEHAAVIRDMHFMLQKEVVDRMAAGPGSKVYGRLSVMLQAYCQVTSLFVVPPGAFRPPPKVDSAVVRLVPRDPASISINDHTRFAGWSRPPSGSAADAAQCPEQCGVRRAVHRCRRASRCPRRTAGRGRIHRFGQCLLITLPVWKTLTYMPSPSKLRRASSTINPRRKTVALRSPTRSASTTRAGRRTPGRTPLAHHRCQWPCRACRWGRGDRRAAAAAPGEDFRYTSGVMLGTDHGTMGHYDMVADDGTEFAAPVAPFVLAVPRTLH